MKINSKAIMLAALVALLPEVKAQVDDRILDAIHQVETEGRVGPLLGDNGKALGPFQIHLEYWQDACMETGKYEDCADLDYAKKVVRAYMARYANSKRLGHMPTYEDIARIHNGGPNGFKKDSTKLYWKKVESFLLPY